jgi:hypothetical protein
MSLSSVVLLAVDQRRLFRASCRTGASVIARQQLLFENF